MCCAPCFFCKQLIVNSLHPLTILGSRLRGRLQLQCVTNRSALLSSDLQPGAEQHLLGAGLCETEGQLSPMVAQLGHASASFWANHNGPEEANGNEACPLLANRERGGGVAKGNSSGGKDALRQNFFYQPFSNETGKVSRPANSRLLSRTQFRFSEENKSH